MDASSNLRAFMSRVTGIGGIFFKANDPARLREYRALLGIEASGGGGADLPWREWDQPDRVGRTVWSAFPTTTRHLDPGPAPFMANYRVPDLVAVPMALKQEGVTVDDWVEESEYGRFEWTRDPEGNRVDLWQPPAEWPEGK